MSSLVKFQQITLTVAKDQETRATAIKPLLEINSDVVVYESFIDTETKHRSKNILVKELSCSYFAPNKAPLDQRPMHKRQDQYNTAIK